MITGTSGGVGSAAVQLAKARGAQVVAVTSPKKAAALQDIGADQTLARDQNVVENSVDVVTDVVGGSRWPDLLDALKPGGRLAVAGAVAGEMIELDLRTLYLKDLHFLGCTVLEDEVFANLISRIENSEIQPLVAETYPLKEIATAQTSFLEKGFIGKIVLEVAE